MKTTCKIHERPEMELPVYIVIIGEIEFFIQRQEGMNPGDTAWYRVQPGDNSWENVENYPIGWTKQESIEYLEKQFTNN